MPFVNDFLAAADPDLALTIRPEVTMHRPPERPWTAEHFCRTSATPAVTSFEDGIEQTRHAFFHFIDQFIDDRVELDLDAFVFGLVRDAASTRVWKPRMMALEAEASATSDSVIVPTAL